MKLPRPGMVAEAFFRSVHKTGSTRNSKVNLDRMADMPTHLPGARSPLYVINCDCYLSEDYNIERWLASEGYEN